MNKSCNQCGRNMDNNKYFFSYCLETGCPNFALLQLPMEEVLKIKKSRSKIIKDDTADIYENKKRK
jgi:hypothetical protein